MHTEDHQRQRIDSSRQFLQRYADENDNILDSIVTGDETWAFHLTPETKQQSREWQHSSSSKPRKFKRTVCRQSHGTTINAERYCDTQKTQTGHSELERNANQGRMPSRQRSPARRPSSRCSPGKVWIGHHHPTTLQSGLSNP